MRYLFFLLSIALISVVPSEAQVTGYYRQPAISGDQIVFNAEGDLWSVSRSGGVAQRITTHAGQEAWPTISPDGQWIAFSASYEGAADTYVIPIIGGTPNRISWDGSRPVGWTPDGHVISRTSKYAGLPDTHLVVIDPATGKTTPGF